jgi:glycosyltransferase involved in cell wall biosynthesis
MPALIPVPDLLPKIPLSARTILDIGCGDGALAASYRLVNPTVRLLGIEADPAAAAVAAEHLDQVATIAIETGLPPFDVPDGIDCIIYRSATPRPRHPAQMFRQLAASLSPDGMMLICVPNAEYWRRVERLLQGATDDDDEAADSFGLEQMRRILLEAGLYPCDVTAHQPQAGHAAVRHFADAMAPSLSALGIDLDDYLRRAEPTHHVWRVRRSPVRRMILSGSMLAPVGGVSHVRVLHPLQAIGTDPSFTVSVVDRVEVQPPADDPPRIFVLHRPAVTAAHGHEMLRALLLAGYVVVTEFDDHPDYFDMMRLGGERSFRGVHALQTSTPALAEVLRKHNPEIAVFPNAVPSLPPVRNFTNPDTVTIFFGALNRESDWQSLMPAINAAAAMAGERLRFQVVHDRQFFDALDSRFKTFTPTCDYETYLSILGASEISLMPLGDTPFNRAKSDLKFIEAGACRVAALASTVVYGDSILDGQTGLLFRDPTEFHNGLLRLVAMPELARELGQNARAYVVQERMLAYQVASRIAWYRSLWQRRDKLTRALRARMDAMGRNAA